MKAVAPLNMKRMVLTAAGLKAPTRWLKAVAPPNVKLMHVVLTAAGVKRPDRLVEGLCVRKNVAHVLDGGGVKAPDRQPVAGGCGHDMIDKTSDQDGHRILVPHCFWDQLAEKR